MKTLSAAVLCASIALSACGVQAQVQAPVQVQMPDALKKDDAVARVGKVQKELTPQECQDSLAMVRKGGKGQGGTTPDDGMLKQATTCADVMLKTDGARSGNRCPPNRRSGKRGARPRRR